jgi:hypothetical protein
MGFFSLSLTLVVSSKVLQVKLKEFKSKVASEQVVASKHASKC